MAEPCNFANINIQQVVDVSDATLPDPNALLESAKQAYLNGDISACALAKAFFEFGPLLTPPLANTAQALTDFFAQAHSTRPLSSQEYAQVFKAFFDAQTPPGTIEDIAKGLFEIFKNTDNPLLEIANGLKDLFPQPLSTDNKNLIGLELVKIAKDNNLLGLALLGPALSNGIGMSLTEVRDFLKSQAVIQVLIGKELFPLTDIATLALLLDSPVVFPDITDPQERKKAVIELLWKELGLQNTDPKVIFAAFQALGITDPTIVAEILKEFQATPSQIALALNGLGTPPNTIMEILFDLFSPGLTESQKSDLILEIANAFFQTNFVPNPNTNTLAQSILQLQNKFSNSDTIFDILIDALSNITQADILSIGTILSQAGLPPVKIALLLSKISNDKVKIAEVLLKILPNLTLPELCTALQAIINDNITLTQVLDNVLDNTQDIVQALSGCLGDNIETIIKLLIDSNVTQNVSEIVSAINTIFGGVFSAEDIALSLKNAGKNITEIALAIESLVSEPKNFATILKNLFPNATFKEIIDLTIQHTSLLTEDTTSITNILNSLGATPENIVSILKSYGTSTMDIISALKAITTDAKIKELLNLNTDINQSITQGVISGSLSPTDLILNGKILGLNQTFEILNLGNGTWSVDFAALNLPNNFYIIEIQTSDITLGTASVIIIDDQYIILDGNLSIEQIAGALAQFNISKEEKAVILFKLGATLKEIINLLNIQDPLVLGTIVGDIAAFNGNTNVGEIILSISQDFNAEFFGQALGKAILSLSEKGLLIIHSKEDIIQIIQKTGIDRDIADEVLEIILTILGIPVTKDIYIGIKFKHGPCEKIVERNLTDYVPNDNVSFTYKIDTKKTLGCVALKEQVFLYDPQNALFNGVKKDEMTYTVENQKGQTSSAKIFFRFFFCEQNKHHYL